VSRILILVPPKRSARSGNGVTASRWAGIFRDLGHHAVIADQFSGQRCDLVVALHARRSAANLVAVRAAAPKPSIVLILTGTDLYQDLPRSQVATRSLKLADRLVVLQDCAGAVVPAKFRSKLRTIYQSASPLAKRLPPLVRSFEITVSGHLRTVKDPFRAELASRRLPPESRIRVTHIGAAMSEGMRVLATTAAESNPRYCWMGELPGTRSRQLVARSQALVVSSKLEGGANVISEAVDAGVPVLASYISGNAGMLGSDYDGYFEVGHTHQLSQLMSRLEADPKFHQHLRRQCRNRSRLFKPSREVAALKSLLVELGIRSVR